VGSRRGLCWRGRMKLEGVSVELDIVDDESEPIQTDGGDEVDPDWLVVRGVCPTARGRRYSGP
jgi:hypothetical protein